MIGFEDGSRFDSLGSARSKPFGDETGLNFGQYFDNRRQTGIGGLTAYTQQVTNQSVCPHRAHLGQVRCRDWLSYNRGRKGKSERFYSSKRKLADNRRHYRLALSQANSSCSSGAFVNRSDRIKRRHFDANKKWACKNGVVAVWTREFNPTEARKKSTVINRSASFRLGKEQAFELTSPEHSLSIWRVS